MRNNIYQEFILQIYQKRIKSQRGFEALQREFCRRYKTSFLRKDHLLQIYHTLLKRNHLKRSLEVEGLLRLKQVRSLSGIVVVSVLTKPFPCPGKCLYCPNEPGNPKSYLSSEPAVMRARDCRFDPYRQVQARLKALQNIGHPVDKVSLRIIGGTWSYYQKSYQTWFIKRLFAAANDFGKEDIGNSKISLSSLQKKNEKAKSRIVELSIETRQDFINLDEIRRLRRLGVTKVELGVQSIYDDVLKINRRGHDVLRTIDATKLLKDAGLKISYQMMLNLPGSNPKKDLEMFKELFRNPDFRPDHLKIYPLAVVKTAPLYGEYLKGKFKPYSEKILTELIIKIKQLIPYYCRIERIIRDIPSEDIVEGGAKVTNLRQKIGQHMIEKGYFCRCIRCREAKDKVKLKRAKLYRQDYEGSGAHEIFLSFETLNQENIFSLLRLRIPTQSSKLIFPSLKGAAIVREIHTYGRQIPLGSKEKAAIQHQGLGRKMMEEAEKIAKREFRVKKIAIISGVGVRDYFRHLGYKLDKTYLIKNI